MFFIRRASTWLTRVPLVVVAAALACASFSARRSIASEPTLTSHEEYIRQFRILRDSGQEKALQEHQKAFLKEAEDYIAAHPGGLEIAQAKLNKALVIGLYGERRDEESDKLLAHIISDYPDSALVPEAMYYQAWLQRFAFDGKRRDEERAIMLKLAERFPGSPKAPLALSKAAGSYLENAGDPTKAAELCRRVIGQYPGTATELEARCTLVDVAVYRGDVGAAREQIGAFVRRCDQVCDIVPAKTRASLLAYRIGPACDRIADWDLAEKCFTKAVDTLPESRAAAEASYALFRMYWVHFGVEKRDEAKELLRTFLRRYPGRQVDEHAFESLFSTESRAAVEQGVAFCKEFINQGEGVGHYRLAWRKLIELLGVLGDPKHFLDARELVAQIQDNTVRDEIGADFIEAIALLVQRRPHHQEDSGEIVTDFLQDEPTSLTAGAAAAFFLVTEDAESAADVARVLNEQGKTRYHECVYRLTIRKHCEAERLKGRSGRTSWRQIKADLAQKLPGYTPDAELLRWAIKYYADNEPWGFGENKLEVIDDLVAYALDAPDTAWWRYQKARAMYALEHAETGTDKGEVEKQFLAIVEDYPNRGVAADALSTLVQMYADRGDMAAARAANLRLLSLGTGRGRSCYRNNIHVFLRPRHNYMMLNRDVYYTRLKTVLAACPVLNNAEKRQLVRHSGLAHIKEEPCRKLQEIQKRLRKAGNDELANEALLLEGQLLLMKWQYADAQRVFEQLAAHNPSPAQRHDALRFTATCKYNLDQYDQGSQLLAQLQADPQYKEYAPEHLYYQAVVKYERNDLVKTLALLNQLLEQYPESDYASNAKKMAEYIRPLMETTDPNRSSETGQ